MAIGAIVARILTQYSDKGSKAAQKDINKMGKNFDKFAKKSAKAFGLAALAVGAFAVKMGKDAVQAAIADQKSQMLLANSLRNTVGATDSAIAGVESYITSLQKQFSVVDDDLRPAMARLTAATGSVEAAQSLMQTALDVSASSGADLATSVGAIIKATGGQFKALKTLVPALSNATIKSKDVAKAFEEVNKATKGSATSRANSLEGRMAGLKIAFGEVLETLGYALMPVLEKFAALLQTKILPQFEAFVTLNKDKLAEGFRKSAEFALGLVTAAFAFTDWISNHMALVKGFALLIAGIWAVGKIIAFIAALKKIIVVMKALRATSAGAAIAMAFAQLGPFGGAAATAGIIAAIAGAGYLVSRTDSKMTNTDINGSAGPNLGLRPFGGKMPDTGKNSTVDALQEFLNGLNKNTTAIKKNTKSIMDIATENARKELAARQAKLSGSSSIAIGGVGSKPYGTDSGLTVNVYPQGNVLTEADLITSIQNGIERNFYRKFGVGAFDR